MRNTPQPTDSFDRHTGRTFILHIHHPTQGDKLFVPVIKDALQEYLRRLESGEVGQCQTDSMEMPSGARVDTVAFGPGV